MIIGILSILLDIPVCHSLKEKRAIIKPLCHRLHREFNASVAEMGHQDSHDRSQITCAKVANGRPIIEKEFTVIVSFINHNFPNVSIIDQETEYF